MRVDANDQDIKRKDMRDQNNRNSEYYIDHPMKSGEIPEDAFISNVSCWHGLNR